MKLIDSVMLKQAIAYIMPSRTEVFLVIDAMPDAIVRCKYCKHCTEERYFNGHAIISCMKTEDFHDPDWFCADGERKCD